jgi:hypothetical protein
MTRRILGSVAVSDLHQHFEGTRDLMLTREDDVDAHALRTQGDDLGAIARHLGHDRKTIGIRDARQANFR